MRSPGKPARGTLFRRGTADSTEAAPPTVLTLDEQIGIASSLTLRHLDTWRLFADALNARLTYVLQPLATWVRDRPAPQERALFEELDGISDFSGTYGDIAVMDSGRRYAESLRRGCAEIGVRFLDLSPLLAETVGAQDWLFVDRIHFTDHGHDVVAGVLADTLEIS
jgi:lysophospholipase L1-like esterase